jgi:hypothetical protein
MKKANPVPAPASSIPFDLSHALAGSPMITRDGQPAKLEAFKANASYPVRCIVDGKSHSFTLRGTLWAAQPDPLDLFMAEEARP